jgi:hypothetical protein
VATNTPILDTISDEALIFVEQFVEQRRAALKKRKAVSTGELVASLEYDVVKKATQDALSILIAFEDSGRFIDMRPSSRHHDQWGRNAIDRIADWVARKGVSSFIDGYLKRRKYLPREFQKLLLSIAWGIAIKRTSGKFRRTVWWNKAKTAGIAQLVNQIAAALPDTTAGTIVDNLKK